MKVVILCGGRGTRITEETDVIPKPRVEIGGKPVLWHIMKIFSHFGFNDFVICLGYRGYVIKEYFSHYYLHTTDITIDLASNQIRPERSASEPWKVTLVDTGLETMTGGRLKRVQKYIDHEAFFLTYGDGVADIDICALLNFHRKHEKMATVTAIQPLGRFGSLNLKKEGNEVVSFLEKPLGDRNWVNGGFFVLEPGVFKLLHGDQTVWEKEPLENLAKGGKLNAFKHRGFWKSMDTLRDKLELDELWTAGKAPWKVWK
jgi:glucose-1-phosphate cytidylyltransferase